MKIKKKKSRAKYKLNFNKVKSHNFIHGKFKIIWKKPYGCDGTCTDYRQAKEICINPNIKNEKRFLSTVIDEILHSNFYFIDNEEVDKASNNMADFLWKLGFRLPKK